MVKLIQTMIMRANERLENAYAPYSNYKVASCLSSEDGNLYVGVNVENASYGLSLCAETSAISQMVTAGDRKIKHLVVLNNAHHVCSPCGACRQRIFEFSTPQTTIHLCNGENVIESLLVDDLLPHPFRFKR